MDYGRPAHLLDCASFVLEAWNAITEGTIHNSFQKAEIMEFNDAAVSEDDEPELSMISLIKAVEELCNEIIT